MLFLSLLLFGSMTRAISIQPLELIVGGSVVKKSELPFTAQLLDDNQFICGGVIISSNWIITAAHCTVKNSLSLNPRLTVRVGGVEDGSISRVKRVAIHPDYDPNNLKNDIALLMLDTDLSLGTNIMTIPVSTASVAANEVLRAAGWGQTETQAISLELREVDLQTMPLSECNHYIHQFKDYSGEQICTGATPGRGTCPGDSGGPLFRSENGELKLVGLTSYGVYSTLDKGRCGEASTVDIYTHVHAYLGYLQGVTSLSYQELTSTGHHQKPHFYESIGVKLLLISAILILV